MCSSEPCWIEVLNNTYQCIDTEHVFIYAMENVHVWAIYDSLLLNDRCVALSLCAVCAFAFLVQFILLFFIHTEFRTTAFLPVVHYTDMIDSSATKCLSIQMPKYLHERHTTELLRITMAQILLFCVSIKLVKMFLHESNITTGSYVIFVCFEPFQRNNLLVCRHDNERSGLFISSYH